jgi:hypothetical protein
VFNDIIFLSNEEFMAGYSKDFLIDAFVSRYEPLGLDAVESLWQLANTFYDTVTKETFRQYCSLDAQAIAEYKRKVNVK